MGMKTETCAVKIETEGNRPCGGAMVYLKAGDRGASFTGWYHIDPHLDIHHWPVPKSWVR